MTYIKVNETLYPIVSIEGRNYDRSWDDRAVRIIILEMDYTQAAALFVDGIQWALVNEVEDIEGGTITEMIDQSAYCKAGDITDHRNGLVTVKMGMSTALEQAVTETEAAEAYREGVNEA